MPRSGWGSRGVDTGPKPRSRGSAPNRYLHTGGRRRQAYFRGCSDVRHRPSGASFAVYSEYFRKTFLAEGVENKQQANLDAAKSVLNLSWGCLSRSYLSAPFAGSPLSM